MKLAVLILLLRSAITYAQDSGNPAPEVPAWVGVDPDLVVNPPEGLDLEGCFDDLITADLDGSGAIEKDEFLNFINVYGERICWYQEELTLEQHGAFNSLACMCRSQEGNDASCCLLDNAKLPNINARNPGARTEEELLFMTVACVVTDGTLQHLCTPYVIERLTEPPVVIIPADRYFRLDDALEDGSIWAIIMGIIGLLLLVCLCCCCCAAGTKTKSREEEEEDEAVDVKHPEGAPEQHPQDVAPRELNMNHAYPIVPPPAAEEEEIIEEEEEEEVGPGDEIEEYEETEEIEEGVGNRNTGANAMEDEDEGDGRRKRGSNYADEEPDDGIPRWGGPRLPPPNPPPPEPVILKPIPPKEKEEDEWDYPNREINEFKTKEEMEGQTFEPYNPDGGVARDDREPKDPLKWKKDWNRGKPPEEDEIDNRKHRVQSGLGEGEVWDKLNEDDQSKSKGTTGGDIFDWVVQSALGVLDKADDDSTEAQDSRTDNLV